MIAIEQYNNAANGSDVVPTLDDRRYYVHPNGSDGTGDGSFAKPWATPWFAATVLRTNTNVDTHIFVYAGFYLYEGFDGQGNACPLNLWINGRWTFELGVILRSDLPDELFDNTSLSSVCRIDGQAQFVLGGSFVKHVSGGSFYCYSVASVTCNSPIFYLRKTNGDGGVFCYNGFFAQQNGEVVVDSAGSGDYVLMNNCEIVNLTGKLIYSRGTGFGSRFVFTNCQIVGGAIDLGFALVDIDNALRLCHFFQNRLIVKQELFRIGPNINLVQFTPATRTGSSLMLQQNVYFSFDQADVIPLIYINNQANTFYYYSEGDLIQNARIINNTTLINYSINNALISKYLGPFVLAANTVYDLVQNSQLGSKSLLPGDFTRIGRSLEMEVFGVNAAVGVLQVTPRFGAVNFATIAPNVSGQWKLIIKFLRRDTDVICTYELHRTGQSVQIVQNTQLVIPTDVDLLPRMEISCATSSITINRAVFTRELGYEYK